MRNEYRLADSIAYIKISYKDIHMETAIDLITLEKLRNMKVSLHAKPNRNKTKYYATGVYKDLNGRWKFFQLHRLVLDADSESVVDHLNGNSLCNLKNNLKATSQLENARNRKGAQVNSKSGIRGVSFHKHNNTWKAYINISAKKQVVLGYFKDIEDAIGVRKEAEKKYYNQE